VIERIASPSFGCCIQPIVDGAFSPDGQHVATASLDGLVKFYEIYQDDEPR